MDITIQPGTLSGVVTAIPSKSQAHRYLICAAFAATPTTLICPETNRDIEATADCLNSLGAQITRTEQGYTIDPIKTVPQKAVLQCCESGSTLRFMLPVVGALGVEAIFRTEGRLAQRPLSPLWEGMERMGCTLSRPTDTTIHCCGRLQPGAYSIDGSVSSQFITGLSFALPLIEGSTSLSVTGKLESKPYLAMTARAQALFGTPGSDSPGEITVEGDWSNGAFWLAAAALGNAVTVENLNPDSPQGDRAVDEILPRLEENTVLDAADIPDLVPILAVVAGAKNGATFTNIRRLRLKESDRVAAVTTMLVSLGGKAEANENTMTVYGTGFTGGTVDSCNDHRIAMAAAIAATVASEKVTILNAQAVNKSYPKFWAEYRRLGGNYEQHIR